MQSMGEETHARLGGMKLPVYTSRACQRASKQRLGGDRDGLQLGN